jgi:hypothetical protein
MGRVHMPNVAIATHRTLSRNAYSRYIGVYSKMFYSLPRERCSTVSNRRESKSIYFNPQPFSAKSCNRKDYFL